MTTTAIKFANKETALVYWVLTSDSVRAGNFKYFGALISQNSRENRAERLKSLFIGTGGIIDRALQPEGLKYLAPEYRKGRDTEAVLPLINYVLDNADWLQLVKLAEAYKYENLHPLVEA